MEAENGQWLAPEVSSSFLQHLDIKNGQESLDYESTKRTLVSTGTDSFDNVLK